MPCNALFILIQFFHRSSFPFFTVIFCYFRQPFYYFVRHTCKHKKRPSHPTMGREGTFLKPFRGSTHFPRSSRIISSQVLVASHLFTKFLRRIISPNCFCGESSFHIILAKNHLLTLF